MAGLGGCVAGPDRFPLFYRYRLSGRPGPLGRIGTAHLPPPFRL